MQDSSSPFAACDCRFHMDEAEDVVSSSLTINISLLCNRSCAGCCSFQFSDGALLISFAGTTTLALHDTDASAREFLKKDFTRIISFTVEHGRGWVNNFSVDRYYNTISGNDWRL
jgi:hypothetical protein